MSKQHLSKLVLVLLQAQVWFIVKVITVSFWTSDWSTWLQAQLKCPGKVYTHTWHIEVSKWTVVGYSTYDCRSTISVWEVGKQTNNAFYITLLYWNLTLMELFWMNSEEMLYSAEIREKAILELCLYLLLLLCNNILVLWYYRTMPLVVIIKPKQDTHMSIKKYNIIVQYWK